ncbi:hypothetical protein M407DRAFT_21135 [Tulasnella calospora MUT 4182]|uniref:Uncharacterized protein n=1 Tax=Tulasnella calospora MUT 4182 TaxID=1051891 RepID=A0A0C3QNM7_9AGAM|nr:hypothetical protein M407DRAFT_21135 [Tulasnella calospora MUT 4182]
MFFGYGDDDDDDDDDYSRVELAFKSLAPPLPPLCAAPSLRPLSAPPDSYDLPNSNATLPQSIARPDASPPPRSR